MGAAKHLLSNEHGVGVVEGVHAAHVVEAAASQGNRGLNVERYAHGLAGGFCIPHIAGAAEALALGDARHAHACCATGTGAGAVTTCAVAASTSSAAARATVGAGIQARLSGRGEGAGAGARTVGVGFKERGRYSLPLPDSQAEMFVSFLCKNGDL